MESVFLNPEIGRADLARLLNDIQTQEKQKLHLVLYSQKLTFSFMLVVLVCEQTSFCIAKDCNTTGTEESRAAIRTCSDS